MGKSLINDYTYQYKSSNLLDLSHMRNWIFSFSFFTKIHNQYCLKVWNFNKQQFRTLVSQLDRLKNIFRYETSGTERQCCQRRRSARRTTLPASTGRLDLLRGRSRRDSSILYDRRRFDTSRGTIGACKLCGNWIRDRLTP